MKTVNALEGKGLHAVYCLAVLILIASALGTGAQLSSSNSPTTNNVPQSSLADRRKQLSDLLAEHWEYTMRTNPEWASMLGDKRFNDKLSDLSEKAVYADLEEQKKVLQRFKSIDAAGFPEQEGLNKTLMVRNIELQLEGAKFREWEMPVTQFNGLHINLPQLVSVLPFDTKKDYEDYVARLRNMPQQFDDTMVLMRRGLADHLMAPKILLEQVVRQSEAIAKTKPEESPFMEPANKLPARVPNVEKTQLQQEMLAA